MTSSPCIEPGVSLALRYGLLRCDALWFIDGTNVSEEPAASIFREEGAPTIRELQSNVEDLWTTGVL
jgi:hypothetical protein